MVSECLPAPVSEPETDPAWLSQCPRGCRRNCPRAQQCLCLTAHALVAVFSPHHGGGGWRPCEPTPALRSQPSSQLDRSSWRAQWQPLLQRVCVSLCGHVLSTHSLQVPDVCQTLGGLRTPGACGAVDSWEGSTPGRCSWCLHCCYGSFLLRLYLAPRSPSWGAYLSPEESRFPSMFIHMRKSAAPREWEGSPCPLRAQQPSLWPGPHSSVQVLDARPPGGMVILPCTGAWLTGGAQEMLVREGAPGRAPSRRAHSQKAL